MFRILFFMAGLFLLMPVAVAQPPGMLNISLAEKSIDITTGFDGARIILYGTRKAAGDIAVIIRGPDQNMVVRRKARLLGIWMNSKSVTFKDVPGYYDLALSRPARDIAPFNMLHRYNIGLDALDFETDDSEDPELVSAFREALIRNQQGKGLFPMEAQPINFIEENFFKISFDLTSNVPAGSYKIDAFLIRDEAVIDVKTVELKVAQNGFSAGIFLFAHNQSLAYSVILVLMAVFFGWGAYALLRRE